jgi:phenylacetate-CoA ligase
MIDGPPRSLDEGRAARRAAVRALLPEHIERRGWGRERLAAHQRDALRKLLMHAVERSPFHAARIAASGIDPAHAQLTDLPRLPTMTKSEMMASFDDVVTDRRLNRALVRLVHGARFGRKLR